MNTPPPHLGSRKPFATNGRLLLNWNKRRDIVLRERPEANMDSGKSKLKPERCLRKMPSTTSYVGFAHVVNAAARSLKVFDLQSFGPEP